MTRKLPTASRSHMDLHMICSMAERRRRERVGPHMARSAEHDDGRNARENLRVRSARSSTTEVPTRFSFPSSA